MKKLLLSGLTALALGALVPTVASAAAVQPSIIVDDSNPNTITITQTGFATFTIDGQSVASGASLTLPDGTYFEFAGTFASPTGSDQGAEFWFSPPPPSLNTITSGMLMFYSVMQEAYIDGAIAGYSGTPYSIALLTLPFSQDDPTVRTAQVNNVFVSFTPEGRTANIPVPEPAALMLLATGLIGLGAAARRRR